MPITKQDEKRGWQWARNNPKSFGLIALGTGGVIGWLLCAAHVLKRFW